MTDQKQPLTDPEIIERIYSVVSTEYPGYVLTREVVKSTCAALLDAIRKPSEAMIAVIEAAVAEERVRCAAVARSWSHIGDAGEIAQAIERGDEP